MIWEKQAEKTVYKGWRNMLSKTFLLPNGEETSYDIVQNGDYVTVAAFTPQKQAIIIKQFRPGPEIEMLSFPEGYIDTKENFLEAAKRELIEETGYLAEELIHLKTIRSAYNTERQFCILALGCEKVAQQRLDKTEFIEVNLYDIEELRAILEDNQREDFANTASAFMALDYLNW